MGRHSFSLAKDVEPSAESWQEQGERGEKTAENVRSGQALSEQGFGGKTTETVGHSVEGTSCQCGIMS